MLASMAKETMLFWMGSVTKLSTVLGVDVSHGRTGTNEESYIRETFLVPDVNAVLA